MGAMPCPACQRDVASEFRFCPYCGEEIPSGCASCGAELKTDFAFCPRCGAPRAGRAEPLRRRPSQAIPRPPRDVRGERRVVTVLFADVVGFTKLAEQYDAETLTEMMNRIFERFGAVVRRYEGVVDKFIGDAAMILFGAPRSHEDDAERAVLTARDMLALLPAVNEDLRANLALTTDVRIHVGIATGLVVAGSVGNEEGGGYTVMGDAVNLASRLVDLAPPSEIYISEATYRLVSGRVRGDVVQTLQVKGKNEPTTVYRVTGADPAAGDSRGLSSFYSPLVGREEDLDLLRQSLSALAEGRGGFVSIEGPPGVGKSRLVRDCLTELDAAGITTRTHLGRCISYGRSVPYYPWSQILTSLLTESIMHRLVPDQLAVLQQVSTGAFGSRTPAEAEKHRETVFWSMARLIESASQSRPRLLVLEDMHWADATSLELAISLLPILSDHRVMLVLVYRSDPKSDLSSRIRSTDSRSGTHLTLAPLEPEATLRLVENLTCNIAGMTPDLRSRIAERSEGVPLFVEEILRSYVESGTLVQEAGLWRLQAGRSGAGAASVPTTLHSLLAARIDRIAPNLRSRLELASVIGTEFDPRLVDRLLRFSPDGAAWSELAEAGEVEVAPDPGGGRDRMRFSHILTHEVIYNTMLRSRRQELHSRVAESLEADRQSEENAHALAWHLEQAGQPEKAAPYWLSAASQARGLYANQEALELYDQAIRVAPSAEVAREALVKKADLLRLMGRTDEAASTLDRLIEMARARQDAAFEAEMLAERANSAYQCGDGPGILRYAKLAMDRGRQVGHSRALVHPLRMVGVAHEFAGHYDEAYATYRKLLEIAETFEDKPHVRNTYNSLGEIARAAGNYQEALEWYEKSAAMHPDGKSGLVFLNNTGAALVGLGEFDRGIERLSRCIEERQRRGHVSFLSEAFFYRGVANLGRSRLMEAVTDAQEAYRASRENGEQEMEALSLRLGAMVMQAGGSFVFEGGASADAALRASVDILHEVGKRVEEAHSRWQLGRLLIRTGNPAEGATELRAAGDLFAGSGLASLAEKVGAEIPG